MLCKTATSYQKIVSPVSPSKVMDQLILKEFVKLLEMIFTHSIPNIRIRLGQIGNDSQIVKIELVIPKSRNNYDSSSYQWKKIHTILEGLGLPISCLFLIQKDYTSQILIQEYAQVHKFVMEQKSSRVIKAKFKEKSKQLRQYSEMLEEALF